MRLRIQTAHVCLASLAMAVSLFIAGCSRPGGADANALKIKGSDTMVHLVSAWAEDYMEAHPDVDLSVTGGGSGTGIAALLNSTTDLCMASREIKPNELEIASQQGKSFAEHSVALDGIAVVVNPENPVETLSMAQLKALFTGEITRWSDVGGPDQPVLVLSRESSSGTYVFFQEKVLEKQDYVPDAKLLPANATIIETIGADEWAIGYVGLGYAEEAGGKVKLVPVGESPEAAVAPTVESVKSGEYPIARPLYIYASESPSDLATRFIEFCLSPEGQQLVVEAGYVPIR